MNFEFEQYFDMPENLRNILVKFRTCNHRLPIEKGRWENVERNNRICNLCNNSSIGDEFHFLLECSYFDHLRKKFIDKNLYLHPNTFKMQN